MADVDCFLFVFTWKWGSELLFREWRFLSGVRPPVYTRSEVHGTILHHQLSSRNYHLHHQRCRLLATSTSSGHSSTSHSFLWPGRYGDSLMLLHIGSVPSLVVSSTEAAREIMKTHDLAFASRPTTRMFRTISYDLKEITVAPYGEYWRQAKSILTLQLLSNKKVQSFDGLREKIIGDCLTKITQCFLSNKPADLSDLFSSLTNDVTCMATFGRTYNEGEIGLSAKVDRVAVDFDEFLQNVVDETLSKKRNNPNPVSGDEHGVETFIDALLKIQKEDILGITIDADVIKALLLDAYVAGTDTSSSVLEWAMTELLLHRDCLEKVQAEIRAVLNGKKRKT
ncbi:unnamed protein product [Lactuca virosa]|uniref:Cytochrome P450 n=1 Tax=Lactuca virosa TaxID=75947 RepID=A0AAU9MNN6_9ASTR|nr:unnamed protein product [Lactuca virosa]